ALPGLEKLKGTLAQSGHALLTLLQQSDEISERLERLYVYASLRRDEDLTNGTYQGMADRASQLFVRASTAVSYIEPEILALPEQTLDQFSTEAPGLALYKQQLDVLGLKRPHIRSAEIEAVLAAAAEICDAPNTTFSLMSNADLTLSPILNAEGEEVKLTHGNYPTYISSSDRHMRKEAFESMHSAFLRQRHTFAATLSTQVKAHLFYARQRNYRTCRERALARYNIPISVYDTLIETVKAHIPLFNRYLQVRKQVLKLDELHMYDLQVPLVEEVTSKVSYQQAQEMVIQALAPLGESYEHALKQAFTQRWIDVYETPGKRAGAYSGGAYGTAPFLLLNWQDNRESMYVLAHELGHCIHSYFTRANQPYPYGNYTVFVAEVASTLNEGLLTEYLLTHTNDRATRLAILNRSLENMRRLLFRQSLSAEFEQQIHSKVEAGEALTADTLSRSYRALNETYYGRETIVDDLIDIEWARIPHFYYDFYVYQYATGISAATALVQQILLEGRVAVERYLQFLGAGSSNYSIELLKKAGVDMTDSQPVYQTLRTFQAHLSQLEELILSGSEEKGNRLSLDDSVEVRQAHALHPHA
ncbi:MAG TPA: oligoendopeptidase F, partial [Ktedonobacteraceae bacterium]|nr:oligoendopeptidase F [Ktedonobacteraceae bacterium]